MLAFASFLLRLALSAPRRLACQARASARSNPPPPSSSPSTATATSITHASPTPARPRYTVKEVALFRVAHDLPDATALYGESFQMLSQTAGTLGQPVDLAYDELKHYKLPQPADAE